MQKLSSFGRDTGLQVRMATVMFLLGLVYVVFVGALIAAGVGAGVVIVIAGGLALLQLFASDKMALAAMGASEVSPQEAPELHAMIERLCVQADLPKPKIADRQHAHAERLRARPLAQERDRLRDDRASWSCSRRPSSRASWPTSSPTSPTAT